MGSRSQWAIFDSAAIKREQWKIDENSGEEGYFFKADTLDELQEKLTQNPYQKFKLPKGRLAETVARYNAFVEKGVDEDFDKPKPRYKIEQGPFYAAWCTVCTHDTYAGLRVNGKNQVVDMAGKVIPGLTVVANLLAVQHSTVWDAASRRATSSALKSSKVNVR